MKNMYAVYGLGEDRETIEAFIGYVPATFFEVFTKPEKWAVRVFRLPSGEDRVGRLCGRAFFVPEYRLKADNATVVRYLGKCVNPQLVLDSDDEP